MLPIKPVIQQVVHDRKHAVIAFLVCLVIGGAIARGILRHSAAAARAEAHGLAAEWAANLEVEMSRSISVLDVLATMVRQADGGIGPFQTLVPHFITNYPAVVALEMQKDGIITDIYPRAGNEAAIGVNLFEDPVNRPAAITTRDSGRLTIHGPFKLMQGTEGIAARLPLYFDQPGGERKFWGFVTAIFTLDRLVQRAGFNELRRKGYHYELRRVSRVTGQSLVISQSDPEPLRDSESAAVNLPGEDWLLAVRPIAGWRNHGLLALTGGFALAFSSLLAGLVHYAGRMREARRQTEQLNAQLAERGERIQRYLEAVPDGLIIVNAKGLIEVVNENALRMFGYGREELVGQSIGMLVPDGVRGHHPAKVASFFAHPSPRGMGDGRDLHARRKDGSEFPAEISLSPIRLPGSSEVLVASSVRDITQRRLAQMEVRKLSMAVEQSPSVVFITDCKGTIEYVNREFTKATGYTREEAVGHKPSLLKSGKMPPEVYKDLWGTILAGNVWSKELLNRRKSGDEFWVSELISPLRDHEGRVTHFIAVAEDITERKRVEREVANQLAFQEALIDTIPYPIFIKDAGARFIGCNTAYEAAFGVTRESFRGKTVMDLEYLPLAARQKYQAEDVEAIRTAGRIAYELPITFADGREHAVLYSVNGFRLTDGSPGGLIGLIVDISDLKQAQQESEASKQQLQNILDGSPVAMVIARQTPDGPQAVYGNRRFTELTGYTIEDARTFEKFTELLVPTERRRRELIQNWRSQTAAAYANRQCIPAFDYEIRTRSGELRHISQSATSVGDQQLIAFNDITRSKQAQEDLRIANFLSDQALELSQAGYWHIPLNDPEGCYNSSARTVALFGDPPRPDHRYHLMREWFANVEAGDAQAAAATMAAFNAALDGSAPRYDAIFAYKRPADGRIIWCRDLGSVVRDASGKPTDIYGVTMDITAARQAEAELQRQSGALRHLNLLGDTALDLTKTNYWHMSFDEPEWFYSNERGARLLGQEPVPNFRYPLAGWAQQVRLGDPAAAEGAFAAFDAMVAGRSQHYNATYAFKRPVDGRVIWLRSAGHVVRSTDGRPKEIFGVNQDITDYKAAEDQLARREGELRAILDQISIPLAIVSPQGVLEYFNQEFIQVLGYTMEEVPDLEAWWPRAYPDAEYRREIRDEWTRRTMEAMRGNGEVPALEARITTRSGEQILFSVWATIVNNRIIVLFSNITEARRAQDVLAQAKAAAEAANEAKSAFLATMSHEIRTPMNAIINMTQLALETELTPKQRQYLSVVGSSGRGLLALINDILDFSKIEAGKIELEATAFSLRQLLDEITDSFRGRVIEKRIEFVVHPHTNVPDELVGDTLRLRQVLINLIGNAFKFTQEGEVVLRVSRAGYTPAAEEGGAGTVQLKFEVQDSGIGIPKDKQGKLFSAFTQVDSSTSRKYGGTGLGLAISKKLVDLMGGELALESEEGKGTTFYFTAGFGCRSEQSRTHILPAGIENLLVLAVDDHVNSRELLHTLIEHFGMRCEVAASGAEALAKLQQRNVERTGGRPYDLVLLDWLMPELDGFAVVQRLRGQPGTAGLPIVMISAFASKAEEDKARTLGVNGFLHKPISASHLFDAFVGLYGQTHTATLYRDRRHEEAKPDPAEFKGVRLLMAEDNEANQFVAEELLTAAGFVLDIASNGELALAKLAEGDYACVLMDMQMPVMDGLTATAEIRRRWPDRRLPIIALTANAMKGDADRCREAGMDDFVSKPIDRRELFKALRRWVPKDTPRAAAPPAAHAPEPAVDASAGPPAALIEEAIPSVPGIDVQDGLRRLGLPWASLKRMLLRFAEAQPQTLRELRAALDQPDWEAARRHAHSIAGAAGNLSAIELRVRAKALEMAIMDQAGDYEPLYTAVAAELDWVLGSIRTLAPAPIAPASAPAGPCDAAALAQALAALAESLESGDLDATQQHLVACEKAGVPTALADDFARVRKFADDYSFAEAGELVATLRKQLSEN